ncbi:MAG: prepilin-type N-terminal cleavage/methylation domain-containing protein [Planctomycetota bacterium]
MSESRPKKLLGRGFSLVELLLASVLLAIVAVGVAAAMIQTPRLTRSAREDVAIRVAMRAIVAEISAAPFSEVPATYDGLAFDVAGIEATKGDEDGLPGSVRIDVVGDAAATYYVVTVSVDWYGVGGVRNLSTAHYLANVRGDTEVSSGGDGTDSTDPNTADDGSGTLEPDPLPTVEKIEGEVQ